MSAELKKGGKGREPQGDLLASVGAESWIMERLKEQGCDVYMDGEFGSLRERIAYVIATYRYGPIVVGRHMGKPETYEQFVLRVFDLKLKDVVKQVRASRQEAAS